jgi:riboflavin kinase/FMN adenylyltransferase
VPANGVYAVKVSLVNSHEPSGSLKIGNLKSEILHWNGMMNIGYRPTVGSLKKMIEVNIFDFDKNIYGQKIQIVIKKYLRPEQKFESLEKLKDQLLKDKENAIQALNIEH